MNYKNRKSLRLHNWDYGSDAAYFITICTRNRENFFGKIQNEKMQVSPAGAIAHVLWHEIKNHTQNIELGEFVVMPNHVHGILILDGNDGMVDDGSNVDRTDVGRGRDVACNVPTETETEPYKNKRMTAISPKSNTVSTIIRSYKSAVTKYCNRLELPFAWQSRFHDHIIRDEKSFHVYSLIFQWSHGIHMSRYSSTPAPISIGGWCFLDHAHFIKFQNTLKRTLPIGKKINYLDCRDDAELSGPYPLALIH